MSLSYGLSNDVTEAEDVTLTLKFRAPPRAKAKQCHGHTATRIQHTGRCASR